MFLAGFAHDRVYDFHFASRVQGSMYLLIPLVYLQKHHSYVSTRNFSWSTSDFEDTGAKQRKQRPAHLSFFQGVGTYTQRIQAPYSLYITKRSSRLISNR